MSGTIYYITTGEAERVKIGFTRNDPRSRLKDLQCGSPHELCIIGTEPGCLNDERDLHGRFASKRLHGEWFVCDAEMKEHLCDVNRRALERDQVAGRQSPYWVRMYEAVQNGEPVESVEP